MAKDNRITGKRIPSGSPARQGSNTDLLPQSISARQPSTSYSTAYGSQATSRHPSMTLRQRSGIGGLQGSFSLSSNRSDSVQERFGANRGTETLKMHPSQAQLIPDRRVCFPNWTGYITTLLFVGFWAGFLIIGMTAFDEGRMTRLTHPTDMFGFTCGDVNYWNDMQIDLTDRGLLYWLDPFELTNSRNKWFAKGICVASCPTSKDVCQMEDLPCTDATNYRCPYYAFAQEGLYNTLPYEQQWGTNYFAELADTTKSKCWPLTQNSSSVESAAPIRYNEADRTDESQQCGKFYQEASQYPGTGPCYAVWAYSKIQLDHCIPVFPPEVEVVLKQYRLSNPNDTRLDDPLIQPVSGWDIGLYALDVINGWELIFFAGFLMPTLLAVMSLLLMQKSPSLVVSIGVVVCVLTILADCLLSFMKGGKLGVEPVGGAITANVPAGANSAKYAHKLWVAIGSLLAATTAALFVLAILLRKHYSTVIKLFKVTARVVAERPFALAIPLLPLLLYCGLALFWIWSSIYLYTSAPLEPVKRSSLNNIVTWWNPNSTLPLTAYELLNITPHPSNPDARSGHPLGTQTYASPAIACAYDPDCYLAISFDLLQKHLFTYSYFGFWLANEFITTVTGVCTAFYMSHHFFVLPNGARARSMPLWRCIIATWLALPPLIIGTVTNACFDWFMLVRPICAIIAKSRAKRPRRDPLEPKAKTLVLAPFRTIGWVAARAMKYSDRQGYFCGALYNKTYWQGCRIAAQMAEEGKHQLDVSMSSAGSVFLLCKGAITGLSTLAALALSLTSKYSSPTDYPQTFLTNAVLPFFICMLSSYFIAELWSQVYEATLSMLLLGYCNDCRVHHGNARMTPDALVDALKATASSEAMQGTATEFGEMPPMKSAYQLETLPHEEMYMDARQIGIESSRRTNRSLNML